MARTKFTQAAQERIYMMTVRDLQNLHGAKRVVPKPFNQVIQGYAA